MREVEPPTENRSNFTPPTTPYIVLTNLQFAIIERNINNYMQCLVDSVFSNKKFKYIADVTSQSQYPFLQNWNIYNERTYINNLILSAGSQSISNLFLSNEVWNYSSDSAVYDASYLLKFDHNKNTVPKVLKGKLRLILGIDNRNLWSIHNWSDFKEQSSDTTWSFLRANFTN